MFRNLIFDWSGTLVDDLNLTLDASNYVFSQYGKECLDREAFREEFQLPYPDYYARVLPEADLEELENHFRKAFSLSTETVEVLPHAREFMEYCRARRIRCFVLTSVDAQEFDIQCRELGMFDYFEAIHAGIRHKNEHIHSLLEQHALDPRETAFIGDMQHDVLTAKHGGITSIAVLTGYNSAAQLGQVQPDMIIPDLQVLRQLFERFNMVQVSSGGEICIKGLEIDCHIGVPDEERSRKQRLFADIAITPVKQFSDMDDDIAHSIDYASLALELADVAALKSRKLIETLAHDLALHCMSKKGISRASVTVRKYILPQTEYVSTTFVLEKRS